MIITWLLLSRLSQQARFSVHSVPLGRHCLDTKHFLFDSTYGDPQIVLEICQLLQ